MMHRNNVVVCLQDNRGGSLREYGVVSTESSRSCTVYLPFESEYRFLVKNNDNRRIKLDIEIDGQNVTNNGLILDKWSTESIERFVNSARKFKFVSANDGRVSDPSNPSNGGIRVIVHKEYEAPKKYVLIPPTSICRGWSPMSFSGDSSCIPCSDTTYQTSDCYVSNPVSQSQVGATVEGGSSNQKFGTTYWAGDDFFSRMEFNFQLLAPLADPEYSEFLRLKEKFEGKV